MTDRTWHKGPPPHVGWWEAHSCELEGLWRWWDGKQWSVIAVPTTPRKYVELAAQIPAKYQHEIKWTRYWPADARVPRIDPRGEA